MELIDFLIYDLVSGRLFNKVTRSPRAIAGSEAGCVQRDGYRRISFKGKWVAAHRIAWNINNPKNPVSPDEQIDHIDHVRTNNRPSNLEKKSNAENHKNMSRQKNNKSGIVGVWWCERERLWYAQIFKMGRKIHIGCFKSLLDAACSRKRFEIDLGFHENHGK